MNVTVAYRGRSGIVPAAGGLAVALAPNLRRDAVRFNAELRDPLTFREAISALHDVVVSDLKIHKKDRTDYKAYLAREKKREAELRRIARERSFDRVLTDYPEAKRTELFARHNRLRREYWEAREKYTRFLQAHDFELFRLIVPLDPVVTVAPDVLFFECFSADESSYGCLSVARDAFAEDDGTALGTTNVDYSWTLYDHFQELRSYRKTRFAVDPAGLAVQTEAGGGVREEKIELPPSWLRGFMQLQSAMSLPTRRVPLTREAVYGILAFLKNHKAKASPRALKFDLTPGRPPIIELEPFGKRITAHGATFDGPKAEIVRCWGRDRLQVLARLLPVMERAEVFLLGTGLPSFWVAHLVGGLRLTLGLSGWTSNDWTGGSALDALAPPVEPSADLLSDIARAFHDAPALTFSQVQQKTGGRPALVAAGLNRLALLGQLIHDLPAGLYRWRQVLPVALSLEQARPADPETLAGQRLAADHQAFVEKDETLPSGMRVVAGSVPDRPCELVLDGDGRIVKGKCNCSHHFTGGLRRGPCRHLQALRRAALDGDRPADLEKWFAGLSG